MTTGERGTVCKNLIRTGGAFLFLFANWKSSGRVIRVQI